MVFFRVLEYPFPFDPLIIMEGIPNDLTCFLDGSLQIVENQIHPLPPNDPRKTSFQKEPDTTKPLKCFAQRSIKHTLRMLRSSFFDEELSNDVGSISPFMLSEGTTVKHTMKAHDMC